MHLGGVREGIHTRMLAVHLSGVCRCCMCAVYVDTSCVIHIAMYCLPQLVKSACDQSRACPANMMIDLSILKLRAETLHMCSGQSAAPAEQTIILHHVCLLIGMYRFQ